MMIKYYRIGGHVVKIELPEYVCVDKCLSSFRSFEASALPEEGVKVNVAIFFGDPEDETYGAAKLLSDASISWRERFRFEISDDYYITTIGKREEDAGQWKMYSNKTFQDSKIYVPEVELYCTSVLSWLIMVAYGQAVVAFDTVLMHASAVEYEGKGYAFLGTSGTGKSTHSRMWMRALEGVSLLNDDNPAVRLFEDGSVHIYGTPWSGKTPCYRDVDVELGAIVRLEQANVNVLDFYSGKEALTALLPSGTCIRWDKAHFAKMVDILLQLVEKVPVGKLRCRPETDAARVCYREIQTNIS